MSSSVADIITCSVCMETYNESGDRRPYLLVCGHTFCHLDITTLTTTDGIRCPLCNQVTPSEHTLAPNFTVLALLASPPKKKKKKKNKRKKKKKTKQAGVSAGHISPLMLLDMGKKNLPRSEVDFVMRAVPGTEHTETQLRTLIVNNRLGNRICNLCLDKESKSLELCNKCFLTWYCSATCYERDQKTHSRLCCNPDADRDQGPMRQVVVKPTCRDKYVRPTIFMPTF
jgi:hypothetical protein